MENLDDFMRQKFNTDNPADRFEFREEYWEQAQALLEAEEQRRKKRRRWLLWWLFAGLLVAAGGWQLMMGGKWAVRNGRSAAPANTRVETKEGNQQSQSAVDQKKPGDKWQLEGTSTDHTGQTKDRNDANNTVSEKNTNRANTFTEGGNNGNQAFGSKQQQARNKNNAHAASKQEATPRQEENTLKPNNNLPQAEQKGQTLHDPSSPLQITFANENIPSDNLRPSDEAIEDFSSLPTLLLLLDIPLRRIDTPSAVPFVRKIEPLRERRFGFGLNAASSFYQSSPDGKWLGGVGGVFAFWNFRPSWALSAGAQWRFLPGSWMGDSSGVQTSEQLRYSFGFQRDKWNLATRGLHFIELPVGVRWRRGALGVEGDVVTGILIGVQGQLTQTHNESLQTDPITSHSEIWLDKNLFRNTYLAARLGAEWHITRHIGLSAHGTYRPGSLLKPIDSDVGLPGSQLWLDIGLRWHF